MSFEEEKVVKLENLNFLTRRELYRKFNSQADRKNECSANHLCFNASGELLAVRCNCGHKKYHLIENGVVNWGYTISPRNLASLKRKTIKEALWILQD